MTHSEHFTVTLAVSTLTKETPVTATSTELQACDRSRSNLLQNVPYLCLEGDPMLEHLVVMHGDPQIMRVIH